MWKEQAPPIACVLCSFVSEELRTRGWHNRDGEHKLYDETLPRLRHRLNRRHSAVFPPPKPLTPLPNQVEDSRIGEGQAVRKNWWEPLMQTVGLYRHIALHLRQTAFYVPFSTPDELGMEINSDVDSLVGGTAAYSNCSRNSASTLGSIVFAPPEVLGLSNVDPSIPDTEDDGSSQDFFWERYVAEREEDWIASRVFRQFGGVRNRDEEANST
ncbi:hypothetical protein B0T14DRAFT_523524 [Immersiella caudata]|uniref:Uncharacterized protein n=1 Tax=Immersiella caudata TaxID=314043 RepID=A0AA40BWW5_9PEZI|nr:hypothetical protein B0T14DRAFT_523524 [Immersiella caudata]